MIGYILPRDISVIKMTGYELEGWGSSLGMGICNVFPQYEVQSGFWEQATSYPQGTGNSFPRGKSGRIVKLVTMITLACH
jgi:hypothetical protein